MFIGLLLVGTVLGAVSGLTALILGHSVWMALLLYSGVGVLGVLAGALVGAVLSRTRRMAEKPDCAISLRYRADEAHSR